MLGRKGSPGSGFEILPLIFALDLAACCCPPLEIGRRGSGQTCVAVSPNDYPYQIHGAGILACGSEHATFVALGDAFRVLL